MNKKSLPVAEPRLFHQKKKRYRFRRLPTQPRCSLKILLRYFMYYLSFSRWRGFWWFLRVLRGFRLFQIFSVCGAIIINSLIIFLFHSYRSSRPQFKSEQWFYTHRNRSDRSHGLSLSIVVSSIEWMVNLVRVET